MGLGPNKNKAKAINAINDINAIKAIKSIQYLVCFNMFNARKELFLLNSKVAFLKSAQNEAEIGPFLNGAKAL